MNRRSALLALLPIVLLCALAQAAAPGVRITERDRKAPVPKITLDAVDGQHVTLAAQRDHVVVLNFWASWCEPCMSELASLNELANKGGDVKVLGVNYMEGAAAIRRVVANASLDFPILRDRDGAAFKAWTSGVLPTSILIDRRGRPRIQIEGALDWTGPEAHRVLDELVNEP
jgi:cytochrome c biogenesis protein CcmG/thiol:disulfide interchange protein DsbE